MSTKQNIVSKKKKSSTMSTKQNIVSKKKKSSTMSTKQSKVSKKKKISQPVSSYKRSYHYEEQIKENLKLLELMVAEFRAQTESTAEFQNNILRDLDHIKSDLMQIGGINQLLIDRNTRMLELLDLLMLMIILDGLNAAVAEGGANSC